MGICKPYVFHALVVIFLEYFAWGLLMMPLMSVSGRTIMYVLRLHVGRESLIHWYSCSLVRRIYFDYILVKHCSWMESSWASRYRAQLCIETCPGALVCERKLCVHFSFQGFLSFLSAPLVGALSDVWGRKLFLIITVFVTCLPIPLLAVNPW